MDKKTGHRPAYYQIIPESFWQDADQLVDYFTIYPFLRPTYCKHCGSRNIQLSNLSRQNKNGITLFRCISCKKGFNQTTGTIFERMQHLELWGEFVQLYLTGKSTTSICQLLPLSIKACVCRANILDKFMAEHVPNFYQWWKPRQFYLDHHYSPQVAQEYQQFVDWLTHIINQSQATCPFCNNFPVNRVKMSGPDANGIRHKHRPSFYCGKCKRFFNLLDDSPLKRLYHIERWLPFVEALVQGKSNYQIAKKFNISISSANSWKPKFIAQMKLLKLNKLVHWLSWQRSRGRAYTNKIIRAQNKR